MDLNELLYHHQVALIRAAQAPGRLAGSVCDRVRHFEGKLSRLRSELGVAAYPARAQCA